MLKSLLLISALILSFNCLGNMADTPSKQADSDDEAVSTQQDLMSKEPLPVKTESVNGDNLVCKRERVTGTHITKKICRTQQQVDNERASADQFMRRARVSPGANPQG